MAGMNTTGFEQYALSYILLYPTYDCFDSSTGVKIDPNSKEFSDKCTPNYFCDHDDVTYKKVDDSIYTLDNLIEQYDMQCAGKLVISMFGMMFFTGFAIGSVVFPPLADKHGRKKLYLLALLMNLSMFVVQLLLPGGKDNYDMVYVFIATFFVQGL